MGVHIGQQGMLTQLADFAGRLLGADELDRLVARHGRDVDLDSLMESLGPIPDVLAFAVVGGTPGRGPSRFYVGPEDVRRARWEPAPHLGRQLVIEVEGGALTVFVDPHESDADPRE